MIHSLILEDNISKSGLDCIIYVSLEIESTENQFLICLVFEYILPFGKICQTKYGKNHKTCVAFSITFSTF